VVAWLSERFADAHAASAAMYGTAGRPNCQVLILITLLPAAKPNLRDLPPRER
jgi:hypothetical protein